MTFDFNKIRRETFDVILPNDKEVSLHILRPTKAQLEEYISSAEEINKINETKKVSAEQQKLLVEIGVNILSRNKENRIFTTDEVNKIFDIDDLFMLFDAYLDYVFDLSNLKN